MRGGAVAALREWARPPSSGQGLANGRPGHSRMLHGFHPPTHQPTLADDASPSRMMDESRHPRMGWAASTSLSKAVLLRPAEAGWPQGSRNGTALPWQRRHGRRRLPVTKTVATPPWHGKARPCSRVFKSRPARAQCRHMGHTLAEYTSQEGPLRVGCPSRPLLVLGHPACSGRGSHHVA